MNYAIIFSTYVNATKKHTPQHELENKLVQIAKEHAINGFSLRNQLGYWAGELEQSHVLELLDTNKAQAFQVANELKTMFIQDAVIVRPIENKVYFI